ncbi:MAG TPA: hypothetical protein VD978_20305 [Azospirillum sp.]|nr:hypothetical protein [Azospirillum sp.]
MPETYDRLASKSGKKNAQVMMDLRAHVRMWIEMTGLDLEWLPAAMIPKAEAKEPSMVDFHHRYIVNGHRISEFYLISLINAWLLQKGLGYRYNEVGLFLREYAVEHFARVVKPHVAAVIADRPRIVVKKKNGRPRKDGTTRTIVVREE